MRVRRESEKNDCCGGGGFLSIDLPGRGRVTAEDEGEGDEGESILSLRTHEEGRRRC